MELDLGRVVWHLVGHVKAELRIADLTDLPVDVPVV
jgi:hypothetical protein